VQAISICGLSEMELNVLEVVDEIAKGQLKKSGMQK
jgi:hypothetical protein